MDFIDDKEKNIVRVLSGEMPLVARPYEELAKKAGLSEEEFLKETRRLVAEKKIRKIGAVLRHRKAGFTANALCAFLVPKEKTDAIAQKMSANKAVSHCYERETGENWPYNLYAMVHAHNKEELESIADKMAEENDISYPMMLYSVKEWKKAAMKYFILLVAALFDNVWLLCEQ